MKTFFTLTIIAAGICIGHAALSKDIVTKIKAAGQKCKEEHKLDDDTYNEWLKMNKTPESDEGKCMVACYMKEMGYVQDGKYDMDAIKESNTHHWDDAAIAEKANNIAKECIDASSDENECEMAAKIMTCFVEKAEKEGIAIPQID